MSITMMSPAFSEGETIPVQYTCDGSDISPPLTWSDPPDGTVGFALISDDPDAPMGTWVHWVVYDIPADEGGLPENVPAESSLDSGAVQGVTDFGSVGYGGPCPPSGIHRYYFKLYALDAMLGLKSGATKGMVLEAMRGHVLAEARLMGRYGRRR